MNQLTDRESNERAQTTWNSRPVGSQRSECQIGSSQYFADLRAYRYGYETPFIPRLFRFNELAGKKVLEIGVGNGIDAVEMARNGAEYTGVDVTQRHVALTKKNFELNLPGYEARLILGDLLGCDLRGKFDVVYSFGVMHHIAHEDSYYVKLRELLADGGVLRMAVYSRVSYFNAFLLLTWVVKNRCKMSLNDWQSHIAEHSPVGSPVTIKIRTRREVETLLRSCGFEVASHTKRGFVQRYIPVLGKLFLKPDGIVLNTLGRWLGWYHVFECRKDLNWSKSDGIAKKQAA